MAQLLEMSKAIQAGR